MFPYFVAGASPKHRTLHLTGGSLEKERGDFPTLKEVTSELCRLLEATLSTLQVRWQAVA